MFGHSGLLGSPHRTGSGTGPAVNADVGIDDILAVTFGDGGHGAGGSAGAATDASVADHIRHWLHLRPLLDVCIITANAKNFNAKMRKNGNNFHLFPSICPTFYYIIFM